MAGLFLSLDGIDGTGKSTQIRLLADWLRASGRIVTTCNDPGGTPIGDALRALVLDHRKEISLPCEALVFMASRAELVTRIIRPSLDRGEIVLSDRFLLANVVYQGYGGGLNVEELWRAGRLSTGGLEPNLSLVLDMPIAVAAERRAAQQPDRLERRDAAYHERVRQGFLTESRRRPDKIEVVNAAQSVDAVQQAIRSRVQSFVNVSHADC
jgi:dTMP kinase